MATTTLLRIKASLGDDLRRLTAPSSISLSDLHALVAARFDTHSPLNLKWLDEDSDRVTIASEDDLREALDSATANASVRLFVDEVPRAKAAPQKQPRSEPQLGDAPQATPHTPESQPCRTIPGEPITEPSTKPSVNPESTTASATPNCASKQLVDAIRGWGAVRSGAAPCELFRMFVNGGGYPRRRRQEPEPATQVPAGVFGGVKPFGDAVAEELRRACAAQGPNTFAVLPQYGGLRVFGEGIVAEIKRAVEQRQQQQAEASRVAFPQEWEGALAELVEMGFEEASARSVLVETNGELKTAVKALVCAEREGRK